MRRTRHVIAVMVVATALCADSAVVTAAAPAHSRATPSRSLASRITTSFRQTVSSVRLQPSRTTESVGSFPLPIRESASGVRSEFSPFQFRLPPPTR